MSIVGIILMKSGFLGMQEIPGMNNNIALYSNFTLPGFIFTWPASGIMGWFLKIFVVIGFISAVPNVANSVRDMFCKSSGNADFMQSMIKDTFGQLTSAGQSMSASTNREYRIVEREKAKQQDESPAGGATPTTTSAPTAGTTGGTVPYSN
jgi:hypothetical protein